MTCYNCYITTVTITITTLNSYYNICINNKLVEPGRVVANPQGGRRGVAQVQLVTLGGLDVADLTLPASTQVWLARWDSWARFFEGLLVESYRGYYPIYGYNIYM